MLTTIAKTLFVVTSIVPHLVVYGCAVLPASRATGIGSLVAAALLLMVAVLFLALVRRKGQRRTLAIQRSESLDREGFAFLLTYALPLLAARDPQVALPGLAAFLGFVLLFLARSEMLWVNPMLVILGFHAMKVIAVSENTYLLLVKAGRQLGKREAVAIRLTEVIWLEE